MAAIKTANVNARIDVNVKTQAEADDSFDMDEVFAELEAGPEG